jgi:hypothetical protein
LLSVAVVYYLDPSSQGSDPRIIKEYHFVLSDDRTHDPHWVKDAIRLIDADIRRRTGLAITRVYLWSDGCASQFKSKHAFLSRATSEQDFGWDVMHNFKASGHGKGEVDGAATLVKSATHIEGLRPDGQRFRNAEQWFPWCVEQLSEVKSSSYQSR